MKFKQCDNYDKFDKNTTSPENSWRYENDNYEWHGRFDYDNYIFVTLESFCFWMRYL